MIASNGEHAPGDVPDVRVQTLCVMSDQPPFCGSGRIGVKGRELINRQDPWGSRRSGFSFGAYPTTRQQQDLAGLFGWCWFIFNSVIADRQMVFETGLSEVLRSALNGDL